MSLHSPKYHDDNPQHPPEHPYRLDTDLSEDPIIAGLEWNVHHDQVDLTWWMTWFDRGSRSWRSDHTTKVLAKHRGDDYDVFYNSLSRDGYYLIINLAEGGRWPMGNADEVFPDNKQQYMKIKSVKVYGF